jgi:inosose dehydratase
MVSKLTGVANSPCSWGVSAFSRDDDSPAYTKVLDEAAAAGYSGVELGDYGFMPTDPELLRSELRSRDLSLAGAFVPIPLSDPDSRYIGETRALEVARLLSEVEGEESPVVVLSDEILMDSVRSHCAGRIGVEQGFSMPQWEVAAHAVNQIALTVLNETGLRTAFHPHCGGFVETPEELSFLMEATHPRILGLCLDTGQYAYGGGDPLQLVRRFEDRVWHVHLKGYNAEMASAARFEGWDYQEAVSHGVFCDPSESTFAFGDLIAELDKVGYSGWLVVEQDAIVGPGTPGERTEKSQSFLKSLGV